MKILNMFVTVVDIPEAVGGVRRPVNSLSLGSSEHSLIVES